MACICNWPDCKDLSNKINNLADDNHPWCGSAKSICLQENSTDNVIALRHSICHHLGVPPDKKKFVRYHVARHHWSVSLWERINVRNKGLTLPLTEVEASHIARNDIESHRLLDNVNKLKTILKETHVSTRLLDFYVCAPVTTRIEVQTFVNTLSSERSHRVVRRSRPPMVTPSASARKKNPPSSTTHKSPSLPLVSTTDNSSPLVQRTQTACPETISTIRETLPLSTTLEEDIMKKEVACHRNTIVNRYVEVNREHLEDDPIFLSSLLSLKSIYKNFDPMSVASIDGNVVILPCCGTATNCKFFAIRKQLQLGDGLCSICQTTKKKIARRESRKRKGEEASVDRTAPNSRVPISSLSPPTLDKRIGNLRKENRRIKAVNRRLRLKVIEQDKYITIKKSSSISTVLQKAFKWVDGESDNATSEIIKSLINLNRKRNPNDEKDEEEMKDFASEMVHDIKNVAKKLDGEDKQARFSPRTLRVCLALYLRTEQGYKDFQNDGGRLYPSARRLEELKKALKVEEGFFPPIYAQFFNFLKLRNRGECDWFGHLMFDEIKLKSDIVWNCRSNDMIGFCSSGTNDGKIILEEELEKVVNELLEDETPSTTKNTFEKEVAVYANQWRWRSCFGVVHNGEFFYTKGNLNGDELVRQWMHVQTCYETIGCKVLGLCSDAGGSNASFFKLIRTATGYDDNHWFPKEMVSTINFLDPDRLVFCWHCSTHNEKNIRNALNNSTPSGSKDFQLWEKNGVNHESINLGWQDTEAQFHRDERRIKNGESKDTDLTRQAVYPDKWNKMNVSLAKAPFTEKTVYEMIYYVSEQLDCFDDLVTIKLNTPNAPIKRLEEMLQLLKGKVTETTPISKKQSLLSLEYMITVHVLFIRKFLNTKEWKLTLANIDDEEYIVKSSLKFFSNWKKQNDMNAPENENTTSNFLAPQTYLNIRIGSAGFFYYARAALESNLKIGYVPAAHSNQSSLEASFSSTRQRGHDSVAHYGRGVSTNNYLNQAKHAPDPLANNAWYDKADVGNEVLMEFSPNDLAKDKRARENILKKWQSQHEKRNKSKVKPSVGLFLEDFPRQYYSLGGQQQERTTSSQVALNELTIFHMDKHFSEKLFEDKDFKEFAKMSIGTHYEGWFKTLSVELDDGAEDVFDECCQRIIGDVYNCLEVTLGKSRGDKDGSFRTQLLNYLQSQNFTAIVASMPETLQFRVPVCFLVQHISELLVSKWIPKIYTTLLEELKPEETAQAKEAIAANSRQALLKDVNRYFGWALYSLQKRVRNEVKDLSKGNFRRLTDDEKNLVLELLGQMRIFEHEILGQAEYVRTFYYRTDFLRNNGFLTLVHPDFAMFGLEVVTNIFSAYSEEHLLKLGNESIREAKREVKENTILQLKFLSLTKDIKGLSDDVKLGVLSELLEKTCNAKMGYITKVYKSKTTGRGGTKNEDMSLRGELKPSAKKKKQKVLGTQDK